MSVALASCSALPPLSTTAHFISYTAAPNIRYEPGGEAYAQELAALLSAAIKQVESAHYRSFRHPPQVFICATLNCFSTFVKTPNLSAAVAANNQLFLTPRLFNEERLRLPSILVHELSHVHFGQQLGHFDSAIPVWFHEGFATFVANGGGADSVTDSQAFTAIKAEQYFFPQHKNSRLIRKYAPEYPLPIHLFYRQAKLFVAYLQTVNAGGLQNFLLDLQDGEEFNYAFHQAYGADLGTIGEQFLSAVRTMPVTQ